jgi:hypothetical protein
MGRAQKQKHVKLYDASDPTQVAIAEKDMADRDRDIVFIMEQPRGRRWIYDLIWGKCHKDNISHVPNDRESTSFNEGARSVGSALEIVLREETPKMYMKMLKENHFDG